MGKPINNAIIYGALMLTVSIGFLIVMPRFGHGEARVTAAQTQIATFEAALNVYRIDTKAYPVTGEGLNSLLTAPADTAAWKGPYLKREETVPRDPWGHAYLYKCPGRHNTNGYDLISCGPDGLAGTEDDITNWQ